MRLFLVFSFFIFLPVSVAAQTGKPLIKINATPTFILPLDCNIDEDCWVMNYVDMGPDDGQLTDPACLSRTYDSHKGTDFAILDKSAMQDGVNVIAPLGGIITKVRDGEPDRFATNEELEQTKTERKECGNAVLIDHGNDLQTIYCHMKKNSIAVKPDQKVKTGDVIGQVGLSGFTQFPHLHFGIVQDQKIIDPFTGMDNTSSCGKKKQSLWNKEINVTYQSFIIQNLGFLDNIPTLNTIEHNGSTPDFIPQTAHLLAFWGVLLGVREGDIITLEIKDPNGKIFATREITQNRNRARQFYYAGLKTTRTPLIEGAYTGRLKIERTHKNQLLSDEKFSAVLIKQEMIDSN